MGDDELTYKSALALARAIKAKELSPVEVLEASLARIDEVNGEVNAIVWRNDDDARAAARRAADEVVHGDPSGLPPFHGVPIPIKDVTPVAGWPVTFGSWASGDQRSQESALIVEALQRAGFVLTGRTNVPEFGAISVSENLRYGLSRNPWDLGRTPGGSSGGAGAAVAAGMFSVAHGNDGGGSIRIPASCCGLVGLKVSRGRIPVHYFSWEGGVVQGALTRDVADAAAILDVTCGPDPCQWYNAPPPSRPFAAEVGAGQGAVRVGLVTQSPFGLPVDAACAEAATKTAAALEALGHHVEPTTFDVADEFVTAYLNIANSGLADYDSVDWEKVEPHIKAGRSTALSVDSLSYVRSVHLLQRLSRQIVSRWGPEFDVMVTPTMTIEPPPAGEVLAATHTSAAEGPALQVLQMTVFAAGFNVTGQPAISLPVHSSPDGVPVGAQLAGGPWGEALLLRLAAQLEQALPWAGRRPAL
jgi:amidase